MYQGKVIDFNESLDDIVSNSYIGIYIPPGYSAQYRTLKVDKKYNNITKNYSATCSNHTEAVEQRANPILEKSDYQDYDNASNNATLQLGVIAQGMPAFTADNQCILIDWKLAEKVGYKGFAWKDDFEHQVHALSAADTHRDKLTSIKNIEQFLPNVGGISVDVSEDYGGLIQYFKIKGIKGDYIHLLNNGGAPTDTGIQNSFYLSARDHLEGVKGLAHIPGQVIKDFPTNQLSGHAGDGDNKSFKEFMWGMKMPLERTTNSSTNEISLTGAVAKDGQPLWVPNYSDDVNIKGAGETLHGGTSPFFRPRSVHALDGRVVSMSLSPFSATNKTPVQRFQSIFDYRVHQDFEIPKGSKETLYMPRIMTPTLRKVLTDNDAKITIVWSDGTDSGPTEISDMRLASWNNLCRNSAKCCTAANTGVLKTCYTKDEIADIISRGDTPEVDQNNCPVTVCSINSTTANATKVKRFVVSFGRGQLENLALSTRAIDNNGSEVPFVNAMITNKAEREGRPSFVFEGNTIYVKGGDLTTNGKKFTQGEIFTNYREYFVGSLQQLYDQGVGTNKHP